MHRAGEPSAVIVHVPVDLIPCAVREEFLMNQQSGHGRWVNGKIFSVSSYKGHALTFQVLLSNGAVFSYLPLHAVVQRRKWKPEGEHFALEELLYHDCKSNHVCAHRFPALAGTVQAYFKLSQKWCSGRYLFTVDWYRGNEQLHLIALDNGQFCALPSHKVLFGRVAQKLPPYQKLRQIWTVGK
jgi:hypothetical protein